MYWCLLACDDEPYADLFDGHEVAVSFGELIQQLSNNMDIDVNHVGSDGKATSPDASEQLISSAYGGIRLHQGLEDREGFGGKLDGLPSNAHLVPISV